MVGNRTVWTKYRQQQVFSGCLDKVLDPFVTPAVGNGNRLDYEKKEKSYVTLEKYDRNPHFGPIWVQFWPQHYVTQRTLTNKRTSKQEGIYSTDPFLGEGVQLLDN